MAKQPAEADLQTAAARIQIWGIVVTTGVGLLGIFTTAALTIGGCTVNHVAKQVDAIHKSQTDLAKLESLPGTLTSFQTEVRTALTRTDERLDRIAEKVAALDGLPAQVTAATTDFNAAKTGLIQSSADVRVAVANVAAATKEIDSIKSSVAKAQEQLDHLKDLPAAVKAASDKVDRIEAAGVAAPRFSSVVSLELKNGLSVKGEGNLAGLEFKRRTDDIPLLADKQKLSTVTIESAHVKFRGSDIAPSKEYAIEPRLDRADGMLYLTLWHKKDEKPYIDGNYEAVFNVSWPERR